MAIKRMTIVVEYDDASEETAGIDLTVRSVQDAFDHYYSAARMGSVRVTSVDDVDWKDKYLEASFYSLQERSQSSIQELNGMIDYLQKLGISRVIQACVRPDGWP